MKEPIGQCVFACQAEQRQRAAVEIAHRQRPGIGHGDESVHLPAIDLLLLLVEAMNRIAGAFFEVNISVGTEWSVRQSGGEA
jgi:hypothetical protein